tara:strand:- start:632 stop:967 length:336 start_codon:yes stop_codon:yes gene_type:complete
MSLNLTELGQKIVAKRGPSGVRAAAKEIGVSPATLSRIENGQLPDLSTFALICKWLGEDPAEFLGYQRPAESRSSVAVHLRKRNTTSVETASALAKLILAAQAQMRDMEEL